MTNIIHIHIQVEKLFSASVLSILQFVALDRMGMIQNIMHAFKSTNCKTTKLTHTHTLIHPWKEESINFEYTHGLQVPFICSTSVRWYRNSKTVAKTEQQNWLLHITGITEADIKIIIHLMSWGIIIMSSKSLAMCTLYQPLWRQAMDCLMYVHREKHTKMSYSVKLMYLMHRWI